MPRFVILEHDWPSRHWDLLLEADAALRSWRLLEEPGAGRVVPAEPNAAHRLIYLDYEGPVGGGRGFVRQWDRGTFDWLTDELTRIVIDLRGEKLSGMCTIGEGTCRFARESYTPRGQE